MRLRRLILNKKGDLKENALSLIIAALGIALLVFAVWKLYDYVAGQDERNAQKTANSIEDQIKALSEGQFGKITLKKIPGWFLTGWGINDKNRPEKCAFKSCICICKGPLTLFSDMPRLCTENGFCRFFEQQSAGAFEVTNTMNRDGTESYTYFSSEQDMLEFLKDPAKYQTKFGSLWQSSLMPSYSSEIGVGTWKESNLEELIIYSDKERVAVIKIRDYRTGGPL